MTFPPRHSVRVALMAFVALSFACSDNDGGGPLGPNGPIIDSESHFLSLCQTDAECGGLQCICGVCTEPCESSNCALTDGACIDASSSGSAALCEQFGYEPSDVCIADCTDDADCASYGSARRCLDQTCLPACGDGVVDEGEDCDDGNLDGGDGCAPACRWESPTWDIADFAIEPAAELGTTSMLRARVEGPGDATRVFLELSPSSFEPLEQTVITDLNPGDVHGEWVKETQFQQAQPALYEAALWVEVPDGAPIVVDLGTLDLRPDPPEGGINNEMRRWGVVSETAGIHPSEIAAAAASAGWTHLLVAADDPIFAARLTAIAWSEHGIRTRLSYVPPCVARDSAGECELHDFPVRIEPLLDAVHWNRFEAELDRVAEREELDGFVRLALDGVHVAISPWDESATCSASPCTDEDVSRFIDTLSWLREQGYHASMSIPDSWFSEEPREQIRLYSELQDTLRSHVVGRGSDAPLIEEVLTTPRFDSDFAQTLHRLIATTHTYCTQDSCVPLVIGVDGSRARPTSWCNAPVDDREQWWMQARELAGDSPALFATAWSNGLSFLAPELAGCEGQGPLDAIGPAGFTLVSPAARVVGDELVVTGAIDGDSAGVEVFVHLGWDVEVPIWQMAVLAPDASFEARLPLSSLTSDIWRVGVWAESPSHYDQLSDAIELRVR